jgi:hypothetical protein
MWRLAVGESAKLIPTDRTMVSFDRMGGSKRD